MPVDQQPEAEDALPIGQRFFSRYSAQASEDGCSFTFYLHPQTPSSTGEGEPAGVGSVTGKSASGTGSAADTSAAGCSTGADPSAPQATSNNAVTAQPAAGASAPQSTAARESGGPLPASSGSGQGEPSGRGERSAEAIIAARGTRKTAKAHWRYLSEPAFVEAADAAWAGMGIKAFKASSKGGVLVWLKWIVEHTPSPATAGDGAVGDLSPGDAGTNSPAAGEKVAAAGAGESAADGSMEA